MTTTPTSDHDSTPSSPFASKASPGRAKRWWWGGLAVILAAGAYGYWGHRHPAASGDPMQVGGQSQGARRGAGLLPVGVAKATMADMPIYLTGLGGITPTATAIVRSRVDGQLMRLHFKEGQQVKAGDLLAEIDPRPYQVAAMQAEGQLARDMAQLEAAKIDLQRYRTLLAQDSIAGQQVDTQAALVKQYEGTIKADQGTLANARLQLTYSRVTAPISGRLGLRQIDVGNIVHASDANGIVVITQVQPITAVFSLPEDHIPAVMKQLQAGKTLPTEAWDRAQKRKLADGILLTLDNQVDATTGTIKLRAQFPNADNALFPNQFVNIRMLLDVRRNATVIPTAAIQRGGTGEFVYVVKPDQTVTVRNVKTGPAQGEVTVIDDGVAGGETVVVDGIDKLREGVNVEPVLRGEDAAGQHAGPALAPKDRQQQRTDLNKRIDAGEYGTDIRKLPEPERRQRHGEAAAGTAAAGTGSSGHAH